MNSITILQCVIFLLVGFVVSLDVAGLTLSLSSDFSRGRSRAGWSLVNAFWHSLLLLFYILLISGILGALDLSWAREPIVAFIQLVLRIIRPIFEWLISWYALPENLVEYSGWVVQMLREHAALIAGLVTLLITWSTYSRKLVSEPSLGQKEELPALARAVFALVAIITSWTHGLGRPSPGSVRESITTHAQAALVAVDMLALAAIMKSVGYLETFTHKSTLIACVFATVFLTTYAVASYGRKYFIELSGASASQQSAGAPAGTPATQLSAGSSAHAAVLSPTQVPRPTVASIDSDVVVMQWWKVSLRLLEPLFIFYFAVQLLTFLLSGEQVHSVGFFVGSFLLVVALVRRHTMKNVAASALSIPAIRPTNPVGSHYTWREWLEDSAPFLRSTVKVLVCVLIAIIVVVLIGSVWYRQQLCLDGLLSTVLSKVAMFVGGLSLIAFFLPDRLARPLEFVEDAMDDIRLAIYNGRHVYTFVLIALTIATVVPIVENFTLLKDLSASALGTQDFWIHLSGLGIRGNHVHALQMAVWLLVLLVASLPSLHLDRIHKYGGIPASQRGKEGRFYRAKFIAAFTFVTSLIFLFAADVQDRLRGWIERLYNIEIDSPLSTADLPRAEKRSEFADFDPSGVALAIHIDDDLSGKVTSWVKAVERRWLVIHGDYERHEVAANVLDEWIEGRVQPRLQDEDGRQQTDVVLLAKSNAKAATVLDCIQRCEVSIPENLRVWVGLQHGGLFELVVLPSPLVSKAITATQAAEVPVESVHISQSSTDFGRTLTANASTPTGEYPPVYELVLSPDLRWGSLLTRLQGSPAWTRVVSWRTE